MQSTRPSESGQTSANGGAEELSFERALARLQDIVAQLEDGSLTLDESIASFRDGAELAAYCQRLIANAELKITTLANTTDEDETDQAPDRPQSLLPGL